MSRHPRGNGMARPALVVAACLLLAGAARTSVADDGRLSRAPASPAYRAECGTCHVPFPPGLLGASTWSRVMNHLPQHYGVDASLDADTVRTLSTWLAAHAGTPSPDPPPGDRITRSRWFVDRHHEVPRNAWTRPSIRSAANCAACHANAAEGDFNEDRVRIPR